MSHDVFFPQTIKDGQDGLIDLFGRIEYFFKRLEKYIEVRPSVAMTDIIVKIMVEVLSILGILTKEIEQGRMGMSFPSDISPKIDLHAEKNLKKLIVGRKDIEDVLEKLDKLTQEGARMAAVEALRIDHGTDNKVEGMDNKVGGVDEGVQSVDMKLDGIDESVQVVDDKVQGDDGLRGVDDKVDLIIDSE